MGTVLGDNSENVAIVLQGTGNCTTRQFTLQDNWHIEYTCQIPAKIEAVPADMSQSTVLYETPGKLPPPTNPTYIGSARSASVAKGGTYSFNITTSGLWQITIYENGFTKDLRIAGATPDSPANTPASATPAPSTTAPPFPFQPGGMPTTSPGRLVASFNGGSNLDKSQEFIVNNNWEVDWTVLGPSYKITLVPTDGSPPLVLVDKTAPNDASNASPNPTPPQTPPPGYPPQPYGMNFVSRSQKGSSFQSIGGSFTLQVVSKTPWFIHIYEVNGASQTASATTLSGTPGATATTPSPAPSVKLTDDQERAVVLITGDNAEGTGFLVKMPDGPAVVTNIHVISNNPNLKVTLVTVI